MHNEALTNNLQLFDNNYSKEFIYTNVAYLLFKCYLSVICETRCVGSFHIPSENNRLTKKHCIFAVVYPGYMCNPRTGALWRSRLAFKWTSQEVSNGQTPSQGKSMQITFPADWQSMDPEVKVNSKTLNLYVTINIIFNLVFLSF